jgi:mannitol/fructose-specific phosphotransferase system IIA component (Ntr-type)
MEIREFLRYFDTKLFLFELNSTTKDEVLNEMVEFISQKTPLKDSRLILDMLRRREQLGSTGIGNGIAIPHGRSISAANLIVAFGKSKEGIEYDAMDKQSVHLIFMIIAPPQEQSNLYLPFLGKLVELLKEEQVREKIQNAETYREFIDILSGDF